MSLISRDPLELVEQTMSQHQYPDGFALFLGTMFAPTEDRDVAGSGFTHKLGDVVTVFGNAGPVDLTLAGSATFGELDGLPGSTLVAVEQSTAQSMSATGRFQPPRFQGPVLTARSETSICLERIMGAR